MDDAVCLLENRFPNGNVELMVIDFSDAFKNLKTHEREKPYLTGRAREWYFAYDTVRRAGQLLC